MEERRANNCRCSPPHNSVPSCPPPLSCPPSPPPPPLTPGYSATAGVEAMDYKETGHPAFRRLTAWLKSSTWIIRISIINYGSGDICGRPAVRGNIQEKKNWNGGFAPSVLQRCSMYWQLALLSFPVLSEICNALIYSWYCIVAIWTVLPERCFFVANRSEFGWTDSSAVQDAAIIKVLCYKGGSKFGWTGS